MTSAISRRKKLLQLSPEGEESVMAGVVVGAKICELTYSNSNRESKLANQE